MDSEIGQTESCSLNLRTEKWLTQLKLYTLILYNNIQIIR